MRARASVAQCEFPVCRCPTHPSAQGNVLQLGPGGARQSLRALGLQMHLKPSPPRLANWVVARTQRRALAAGCRGEVLKRDLFRALC